MGLSVWTRSKERAEINFPKADSKRVVAGGTSSAQFRQHDDAEMPELVLACCSKSGGYLGKVPERLVR